MHLMIGFDKAKVAKTPASQVAQSHCCESESARNQKTIPIAPARIFMLWKELISFRLFEAQWEVADSTSRALRSLKTCKDIFVY